MKKVSIIVPVYNVEKYLEKCLTSLVNQTLDNIEIIVVNDGTKDNSQIIIDKFKAQYPSKIVSIIKENGGQGSARNYGLKVASGEYIGYVDGDDYVDTTMFEKLYNVAKEDDSDIVICGNYVVDENNNVIQKEILKIENNRKATISENRKILFDKMAVWNKIYKADFLKSTQLEFRNKKWYEDFDFSVNVLLSSKSISIVEEPLYYYLIRQGSTMNNSNINRNLEIKDAMCEITKFVKTNNLYDEFYEEIEYLAIFHVYLVTIVRVINAKVKTKKNDIINGLKEYVNYNFRKWNKNKYIKSEMTYKRRLILNLIRLKLYFLINIIFKLKNINKG